VRAYSPTKGREMEQLTQLAAESMDSGWSLMTANPVPFIVAAFFVGFLIGAIVVWILLRRSVRISRSAARYYKDLFKRGFAQQLNDRVTRTEAGRPA
jgi:hypothetical protein